MRLATALLSACLLTRLTGAAPPPTEMESGNAILRQTVNELFDVLATQGVELPTDPATHRQAIQSMLDALGVPARLSPNRHDEVRNPSANRGAEPVISHAGVLGGLYGHARIAAVEKGLDSALTDALGDMAQGHFAAIVLDLRHTGGLSRDAAIQTAAIFHFPDLPVVLLVDGHTRDAAEVLVSILKTRDSVTAVLGQPTQGIPLDLERTSLKSGDLLLIAKHSGDGTAAQVGRRNCIVPTVTVADVSRPAADDAAVPQTLDDLLKDDACLRRAVDLLSAMSAFNRKL